MPDLLAVSDQISAKEQLIGFESLSPAEQVFHAVWDFEGEINSDGFDGYFLNSPGDHAAQALAALERIGASSCADILRRACALFPDSTPSPEWDTRQDQVMAITDKNEEAFEELDAEFFEYPDDISGLLEKFWATNGV